MEPRGEPTLPVSASNTYPAAQLAPLPIIFSALPAAPRHVAIGHRSSRHSSAHKWRCLSSPRKNSLSRVNVQYRRLLSSARAMRSTVHHEQLCVRSLSPRLILSPIGEILRQRTTMHLYYRKASSRTIVDASCSLDPTNLLRKL
jgi:hypothetical protein